MVKSRQMRRLSFRQIERLILHLLMIALAILMLIPFVWMVSTSVKPADQILSLTPEWLPDEIVLENFSFVWNAVPFLQFYTNSLLVATVTTLSTAFLAALAGYALAKFEFPGRDLIFISFLATMMVPSQVTFIPLYIIMAKLHWIDTYLGLITPGLISGFGVFLMRQYIRGLPTEFIEAARIDGASELRIFLRIILPLSTPALATVAIFTFMGEWDAFLWPLIVTNSVKMKTIPLGIASFYQQEAGYPARYNWIMAANLIGLVPVLIVFLSLQRYFVRGIVSGGIKG